jgi:starch synthase
MPLRICYVTAELTPLAKAGGLADVAAALLKHLTAAGHDIRLFMPAYSAIDRQVRDVHAVDFMQKIQVKIGVQDYEYSVLSARMPGNGAPLYLIDCPACFSHPDIYTGEPLEYRRFLLLTHAAFMCCQRMGFAPQILHCNDWHTAMAPLWLRTIYRWDRLFADTRSVLTIHNLGYQGIVGAERSAELLGGAEPGLLHQPDLQAGHINMLRTGIQYADQLTTVSPGYAREILTPAYGMGLEDALRARSGALTGILNGVDYEEWDPRHDRYLPRHYGPSQLRIKAELKRKLLARLGLKHAARRPLIGIISRLATQKGFDLLMEALPPLLAKPEFNLVVLGAGEPRYEDFFARLQGEHAGRVHFHCGYNDELAHWIEAGSNMFLMPSRYEPCGLNQLYSLRYGSVPIVRRTGGLADTITHFDATSGAGTGIVFDDYNAEGVTWAIDTALSLYLQLTNWRCLVQNGMAQDFSWPPRIAQYIDLYRRMVAH